MAYIHWPLSTPFGSCTAVVGEGSTSKSWPSFFSCNHSCSWWQVCLGKVGVIESTLVHNGGERPIWRRITSSRLLLPQKFIPRRRPGCVIMCHTRHGWPLSCSFYTIWIVQAHAISHLMVDISEIQSKRVSDQLDFFVHTWWLQMQQVIGLRFNSHWYMPTCIQKIISSWKNSSKILAKDRFVWNISYKIMY